VVADHYQRLAEAVENGAVARDQHGVLVEYAGPAARWFFEEIDRPRVDVVVVAAR